MKDVEVVRLIRTNLKTAGTGQRGDPVRRVQQYWTEDGQLLFEVDPLAGVAVAGLATGATVTIDDTSGDNEAVQEPPKTPKTPPPYVKPDMSAVAAALGVKVLPSGV